VANSYLNCLVPKTGLEPVQGYPYRVFRPIPLSYNRSAKAVSSNLTKCATFQIEQEIKKG